MAARLPEIPPPAMAMFILTPVAQSLFTLQIRNSVSTARTAAAAPRRSGTASSLPAEPRTRFLVPVMILARIEWVGTIDVRKARSGRLLEHHPQFLDGLVVSADTWQSNCIVKSVVPVLGNVGSIRCEESPPVFVNPLSGRGHVTAKTRVMGHQRTEFGQPCQQVVMQHARQESAVIRAGGFEWQHCDDRVGLHRRMTADPVPVTREPDECNEEYDDDGAIEFATARRLDHPGGRFRVSRLRGQARTATRKTGPAGIREPAPTERVWPPSPEGPGSAALNPAHWRTKLSYSGRACQLRFTRRRRILCPGIRGPRGATIRKFDLAMSALAVLETRLRHASPIPA